MDQNLFSKSTSKCEDCAARFTSYETVFGNFMKWGILILVDDSPLGCYLYAIEVVGLASLLLFRLPMAIYYCDCTCAFAEYSFKNWNHCKNTCILQWIQFLRIYISVTLGKPEKLNLLLLHASYKDCGPTWYTILPQMDSFAFR